MTWAYWASEDQVEEHDVLPQNWQNVSNFHVLVSDPEYLNSLGWYQVVDQSLPIQDHMIEYYGAPIYTLDLVQNLIIKVKEIKIKESSPNDYNLFDRQKNAFLYELRQERNQRLAACDWTQLYDIVAMKSEEWLLSWASYRQQLRDLPVSYESITDINQLHLELVEWPDTPAE